MSFNQVANHVIDMFDRKAAGMYGLLLNHAGKMEGEAKTRAPWKDRTTTARRSIHSGVEVKRSNKTYVLYLAHGVQYGRNLEEGTPPHIIRPNRKKALYWPGAKHPVKKVNHPGTKPYPAIKPTVENNILTIRETVRNYWRAFS